MTKKPTIVEHYKIPADRGALGLFAGIKKKGYVLAGFYRKLTDIKVVWEKETP